MDRLEAMWTIEIYGWPESEACKACGHTMPSVACQAEPEPGEGLPCPLLVHIQSMEAEDDVKAAAAKTRAERASEN
jgi:hypothetical protein